MIPFLVEGEQIMNTNFPMSEYRSFYSSRMGTPRMYSGKGNDIMDLDFAREEGANLVNDHKKTPLDFSGSVNCWSLQPFLIGNFLLNQSFQQRCTTLQRITYDKRSFYVQRKRDVVGDTYRAGKFSRNFLDSIEKREV